MALENVVRENLDQKSNLSKKAEILGEVLFRLVQTLVFYNQNDVISAAT